MNDSLLTQKLERCQNLNSESSDEIKAETIIIIPDNKFVEILTHFLKKKTNMSPEDNKISDFDDI